MAPLDSPGTPPASAARKVFLSRRLAWGAMAAAALILFLRRPDAVLRPRVAPLRDYAWGQHVRPIRDGQGFKIPINPEGWYVQSTGRNSRRE